VSSAESNAIAPAQLTKSWLLGNGEHLVGGAVVLGEAVAVKSSEVDPDSEPFPCYLSAGRSAKDRIEHLMEGGAATT